MLDAPIPAPTPPVAFKLPSPLIVRVQPSGTSIAAHISPPLSVFSPSRIRFRFAPFASRIAGIQLLAVVAFLSIGIWIARFEIVIVASTPLTRITLVVLLPVIVASLYCSNVLLLMLIPPSAIL